MALLSGGLKARIGWTCLDSTRRGLPEPVFVTARDGMKELLVDIFTGVFEPVKIARLRL